MEENSRWKKIVNQYGSEEAAREEMRRRASTSSRNKAGTGGFASMSEEKRKQVSEMGVKARENKQTPSSEDSSQS